MRSSREPRALARRASLPPPPGLLLSSSLTTVCNPVDSVGRTGDFSRNSGDFPRFGQFAIAGPRAPCQTHTQPNHLPCSLPRGEEPAGNAENRATGAKRLRRRRAEGSARIGSAGTWQQEPVAAPPAARQAGLLRTEPEPPEAAAIGRDRGGSEETDHLCGVARPLETIRTEAPRSRPAQAGKLLGASPFQHSSQAPSSVPAGGPEKPTGASRRAAGGLAVSAFLPGPVVGPGGRPREADRRKPPSRWGPRRFSIPPRPSSSTRPPRSGTAGTARRTLRDPPEQALRATRTQGHSPCAPPDRPWARRRAGAA